MRVGGGGDEGRAHLHRGVHGAQQGAGDGAEAAQEVGHRDGGAGMTELTVWQNVVLHRDMAELQQ